MRSTPARAAVLGFLVIEQAKYSAEMLLRPLLIRASFSNFLIAAAWVTSCAHPETLRKTPALVAKQPSLPAPAPPPPLSLVPADVARTTLLASFVIPAFERSLSSGVALVKKAAPLPLDAKGVRDMLLAQVGLPPDVAAHLDLTAPIAGAAVGGGPGRSPLTAFTFAGRSALDVTQILEGLGRTVTRRGAAVQIENASGDRGWFLPQGNLVVFSDSDEALVRAGSLAIEARRGVNDDVLVTLSPEMMARAGGTDLKSALERLVAEVEQRAATGGNKIGPEGSRQIRDFAEYLIGAETVELALDLDAAAGASVLVRLNPRSGSKLEGLARQTRTISVDPALLATAAPGKDDVGFLATSTYGHLALEQFQRQRAKLPAGGDRAVLVAGQFLDALGEGLTGDFTLVGRAQPGLFGEIIYPVRDAAAAKRIGSALLANDKASLAALLRAAGQDESIEGKIIKVRQESVGKTRALHATVQLALRGDSKGALQKLIGPTGLEVFIAVVGGDRVAVTVGQGARARLAALGAGNAGKSGPSTKSRPLPAIADAVATASTRSFFFLLDLRQVLSLTMALGDDPRLRLLGAAVKNPMPTFGGAKGDGQGKVFTLDLIIPPACFSGIGVLLQAAMMTHS
jgi:hypothetical protein